MSFGSTTGWSRVKDAARTMAPWVGRRPQPTPLPSVTPPIIAPVRPHRAPLTGARWSDPKRERRRMHACSTLAYRTRFHSDDPVDEDGHRKVLDHRGAVAGRGAGIGCSHRPRLPLR